MEKNSTKRLWVTVLSIIGLVLTLDLAYIYIKTNFLVGAMPSFCSINNFIDCDGVARTKYAVFMGIPLAFWGLILYSIFLMLSYAEKIQEKFPKSIFNVFKNPFSYISTLGLISFAISIMLAIISITEIKKICYLCFITYFLNFAIAIVAGLGNSIINDIKNTIIDFIDGVKKHFILFLVVVVAFSGTLFALVKTNALAPTLKAQEKNDEFKKFMTNKYKKTGNILGKKGALAQVYVYSDLRCPFCKITNSMLNKLPDDFKHVEITHVNYPLDSSCNKYVPNTMHQGACELSKIALAAKNQGNYWGMVNEIFEKDEVNLKEISEKLNLDYEKLKKDATSKEIEKELLSEIELAHANSITATPTIIINDINYIGSMTYSQLLTRVKQAHKREKNNKN